jgi:hypothetical protein
MVGVKVRKALGHLSDLSSSEGSIIQRMSLFLTVLAFNLG